MNIEPFIQDSHAKYYWLGILASDGNVAKTEARIRLEVKADDIDLLEKLAQFVETDMPIRHRVNNTGCHAACLEINSSKLKKYLADYNIVPNKTFDFTMPLDKIPKEYIWDFVRGLMDGDGCISIFSNKKYNPYGISFVSANKQCVEQMKDIWEIDNAISFMNNAYIVQKNGMDCLTILNKMYENSTELTRLNRKYNIYRSLIE